MTGLEETMIPLPRSLVERMLESQDRLSAVLERLAQPVATPVPSANLLTKQEAAALLGGNCSVRRVERLVKRGKLRKVEGLGSRTVRFRRADIEQLSAPEEVKNIGRRRL